MVGLPLAVEHFAGPPHWEWYIWGYFFLAGLTGGCYALAAILRLWGEPSDEVAARLGFYAAFGSLILCPILLSIDLGQPLRFWHMMTNTTPGVTAANFKSWSPMSVGVWALLVYGFFATVTFLAALGKDLGGGWARAGEAMDGVPGRVFVLVGGLLGLFIASYTGVLLSVSNQPVWSDTWSLGGLFLASGLSGSAALMTLLVRRRPEAAPTGERLRQAEGYFALLELALIVLFFVTVGVAGTLGQALGGAWWLLWLLVLVSLAPPLAGLAGWRPVSMGAGAEGGGVMVSRLLAGVTWVPLLVLLGVLALRAAVIFGAQS
ncbi:MAG TPA: NrfD/PsrC family molybdoenzyme membrane anchor subunit [Candidatus Dormibacteraeota bacterium]|jgi:formate-dependent nitrite reductase membrane component NrfD|nr:NrfD/PsrC family molybdoenzyme membrane anchor subunit [Candidatus Dormibacteraeota bacterium]